MPADDISLREYMESRFVAFGHRLDAYVNQHKEMHEKLAEQVAAAAHAVDKRLEGMNELRAQISTERGQFATRDMLDQRLIATGARIDELSNQMGHRLEELSKQFDQRIDEQSKRMSDMERAKANMDGRFSMLAMVLGGLTILINLLLNLARK